MLENVELLEAINQIATLAGREIMAVYSRAGDLEVTQKLDDSPLTEADTRANALICEHLQQLDSSTPILSEEDVLAPFTQRTQWREYWLIDPLDGTKEFIQRNGEFTVNIALVRDGVAVLGVVHAPVTGTSWLGVVGLGAWKRVDNEAPLQIHTQSLGTDISRSTLKLIASRRHGSDELEQLLERLARRFAGLELLTMGSSLKFCLLAEGKADFYPRLAPTSEWDTAAAQAILEAAGGQVLRADFSPLRYNQKEDILNPHFFAIGDSRLDWQKLLKKDGI